MRTAVTAWLLTSLVVACAASAITGWRPLSDATAAIVIVYFVVALRQAGRREIPVLAMMAATAAAVLLLSPAPWTVMLRGTALGATYASLVLALSFLQAPASRSRLVRRCGEYLIHQGPGRRYLALTGGAHLFAIVLSIGTLTLLGTMVRQSNTLANAGGDPRIMAIRERRMVTAVLRGFAAQPMWASSSIGPSVVLTLVPAVTWPEMAPYGLAMAIACLAAGWALDRLTYSRASRLRVVVPQTSDTASRTILPLSGIVGSLMVGILIAKWALGWSLATTVLVVVPLAACIWLLLQTGRQGWRTAIRLSVRRLGRHTRQLGRMRYEVFAVTSAGFIGAGVTALLPPGAIGDLMEAWSLPPVGLLIGVAAVIALSGIVGINPIVSVTVLGSAVAQAGDAIPPMAIVMSLLGPWALYVSVSPVSASAAMLARMFGRTPTEIAFGWNGVYSLLAFLVQGLFVWALVETG